MPKLKNSKLPSVNLYRLSFTFRSLVEITFKFQQDSLVIFFFFFMEATVWSKENAPKI